MATAAQLVDLADSLNGYADEIDSFIGAQSNPFSSDFADLRAWEGRIAGAANQVAALAIEMLVDEIAAAASDLSGKVAIAQGQLKEIEAVGRNLKIAATILSVAEAAATGDPFAAVKSVDDLACQLQAVLQA
ncbi:MAG TPA: hypothetical protein VGV37_15915 [Aliidongia sp.]|uniref:hypothetical protein n=1 Tax=Aliidongia sp. TaxID=1914230 RepID=UPI002DDD2CE9|nr:hypothetical protein [Aliidongia sp.]HEV2676009.1 hypothetical protein [Aliidongia sp.]